MGLDMMLLHSEQGEEQGEEQREEVAYWRKVNAVHKWFVDNVQGGKDDCGSYPVDRDKLRELLKLCRIVLDSLELEVTGKKDEYGEDERIVHDISVAEKLLPPQEGFFFGSTEIDNWYAIGLEDTIRMLESALTLKGGKFTYQSSW